MGTKPRETPARSKESLRGEGENEEKKTLREIIAPVVREAVREELQKGQKELSEKVDALTGEISALVVALTRSPSPTPPAPSRSGPASAEASPAERIPPQAKVKKDPAKVLIHDEKGLTDEARAWLTEHQLCRTVAGLARIPESLLKKYGCPDTVARNFRQVLDSYRSYEAEERVSGGHHRYYPQE